MTATRFTQRVWRYAGLYIAWIVLLLYLGGAFHGLASWVESMHRWDALWYQDIAQRGYNEAKNYKTLAFPPVYPLLVGALSRALGIGFDWAAIAINLICYFVAVVLAVELFEKLFALGAPYLLFGLLLTSPTAYFAFSAYSDMLFMCMLWGLMYLLHLHARGKASLCVQAVLLLTLPWVRIAGYAMMVLLLFKKPQVIFVQAAFVGWLWLNYSLTGNMWHFIDIQTSFLLSESLSPWQGAWMAISWAFYIPETARWNPDWIMVILCSFLPVLYFCAITAASIWLWKKDQKMLAAVMMSLLMISHYAVFWRSVVRYDMQMMPCLFVPLLYTVRYSESKRAIMWCSMAIGGLATAQLIMQILFTWQFKQSLWAF